MARANNIEDYSGFVFSEEDDEEVSKERKERDRKAEEVLDEKAWSIATITLHGSFSALQVGRVLILLCFLLEGTRVALSAQFKTPDDLKNVAKKPELWETH